MNPANSFKKDFFGIDNQFCLWQNKGNFMKKHQCQASKHWKM